MELKDRYKLLRSMFDAPDGEHFGVTIQRVLDSPERNQYLDKYVEAFPDLSKDYLRSCWQFWFSDREEKKQDYTPEPLANLCAHMLTMFEGNTIYDCCAGSGALTIAVWNQRKEIKVACQELDEEVIPLLLFNLSVRNIEGVVQNGDVITGQVFQSWELVKGERYSSVTQQMFPGDITADLAISNPPYNIRVDGKKQNFAFAARCMDIAKRSIVLLPGGTMTSKDEAQEREKFCKNQWVQSVVLLPENLFESTGIPVTMYVLDRRPKDCAYLVDASTYGTKYIREQRGEGSKSHTERIYKKEMVRFTDEQIAAIQQMTEREVGGSTCVAYSQMSEKGWSFSRGQYLVIDIDASHTVHRSYTDIIADINKVNRMRNTIKVTVNKVWAEELGLIGLLELSGNDKDLTLEINRQLSSLGIKEQVIVPDWLAQTNSKELKIVQVDKEILSPVFVSFIPLWYQHLRTMNDFETILLRELRDALLEPLLTGRIGFVEQSKQDGNEGGGQNL